MKKTILSLILLFATAPLFAQSTVTIEQLLKQVKALEARVTTLETKVVKVQEMNERLRKVADFGQPITEAMDNTNGIKYKILSVVGDKNSGQVVITLSIEAVEKAVRFQFSGTYFVNLYGISTEPTSFRIAGQNTISFDLQKAVPLTAQIYFDNVEVETNHELKLFQFENIGSFNFVTMQFRNLQVTWH